MADDFASLCAAIRRVYPDSDLQMTTDAELNAIRKQHPDVPEHYLAFLREVGWGSLGDNLMLYRGVIEPDEVFDSETAQGLNGLLFFGDNFSGDMVGFDTGRRWSIIEVWHDSLRVMPSEANTVAEFISKWVASGES